MRCPICNTENAQDATTCQQCGFGLVLASPQWPDAAKITFPDKIPVPEKIPVPKWTGSIEPVENVEISQAVPKLAWPDEVAVERVGPAEPSVPVPADEVQPRVAVPLEPPVESDNDLARLHIERGLEAFREQMFDQARWEFEQARHLAEDLELVQMAEERLNDLRSAIDREVEERLSAIRPSSSSPSPPSVSRSTTSLPAVPLLDWTLVFRASLVFGLVAAILAALSGGGCLGIIATPVLGLFAGVIAGKRKAWLNVNSGIAGGLVGLGGALGSGIGQFLSAIRDVMDLPSAVAMFLFFMIFYSFLSAFAGLLGGFIAGVRSRA